MSFPLHSKIVSKQQREGVPIVGVVLTDGISKNKTKTTYAANALKDLGVTMYSIGVTDIKNKEELNNIASSPENVITFQTFDELAAKLESLVKLVCPSKKPFYQLFMKYKNKKTNPEYTYKTFVLNFFIKFIYTRDVFMIRFLYGYIFTFQNVLPTLYSHTLSPSLETISWTPL